jgi:exopolysaccharide production protein ExoZ
MVSGRRSASIVSSAIKAAPDASFVNSGSGNGGATAHPKWRSLQALRAVAASLVVMFHTQVMFGSRGGPIPFHGIFTGAGRGVDLFFVLSGFIVTYTHAADWGKPDRVWHYLFNRLSRIYPAVWVMTIVTTALALAGLGGAFTAHELSPWSFIVTAFLLPFNVALVGVIWSLKVEIFFYFAFALVIVRPRLGWCFIAVWQIAVVVFGLLGVQNNHLWFTFAFYVQPMCLEFCMGMACATFFMSREDWRFVSPVILWASLFIGTAAFATAVFQGQPELDFKNVLIFGTSSALIITSLIILESLGRVRIPGWLVRVGDSSYCIYLAHFSVIAIVSRLIFAAAGALHWPINDAICIATAAVGVGVGIGFDHAIDRPLQRHLRRVKRRYLDNGHRSVFVPQTTQSSGDVPSPAPAT